MRRAATTVLSVGIGGASLFGLVDSLATHPTPNVSVTTASHDDHRPEPGATVVSGTPQFKRVPMNPELATRRRSRVVPAAFQFEPAADYQPPTAAQIPDWASPLPQRDTATRENRREFQRPNSDQVQVPRMADRTTFSPRVTGVPRVGDNTKFSFTFKAAPWSDVVRQFAARAGYQLRMESIPTGTFDLYDTHQYSPVAALDLINGYLIRNGHLLVRNDQTLTLISVQNGIPRNLVPAVSLSQLDQFGRNEVVSVPMPVPVSNKDIAATLKPLLGQLGTAVPIPGTRQMLVTDTTASIRRLQSVLGENSPVNSQFGQVYQLRNSSAKEIAKALNELFGNLTVTAGTPTVPTAATTATRASRVIIVPESQTNSLLINAPGEMMPQIHQMIGQLDRAPQQVVIQALLVEVDLGNVHEVGVEVGVQDSVLFDRSVVDNLVTLTETVSNPGTGCLLYTSPSPRDQRGSRMPSSA